MNENKLLKRVIMGLSVMILALWGGIYALAEATNQLRLTTKDNELAGIIDTYEAGDRNYFYQYKWDENDGYTEWLVRYGLTGSYGYGWIDKYIEMKAESELAQAALSYWEESCGITPYNDFSMASMVHPVHHETENYFRNLVLVIREHDDKMPDFYVLMDADTGKILSSSDPETYKQALKEAEKNANEERKLEGKIRQIALDEILSKYGESKTWLNDAYLDQAYFSIFQQFAKNEEELFFVVQIFPGGGNLPEFTVELSLDGAEIFSVSWDPQAYGRCSEDELAQIQSILRPLEDQYLSLIALYGTTDKIPLEEKVDFYQQCKTILDAENAWDFIGVSQILSISGMLEETLLMPEEGKITEEEARQTVADALIENYGLTQDQAQSMAYGCWLLQERITRKQYWKFTMFFGDVVRFHACVDAETGEVYALHFMSDAQRRWNNEAVEALKARYSEWGEWPISIKAKYAHIYLGPNHEYGMPNADQIQPDEALVLAKEELIMQYPELSMEQLNQARICPYFAIKPYTLYGTRYNPPVYYFTFDVNHSFGSYEIILDGETGEVYLTLDPSNSGNG